MRVLLFGQLKTIAGKPLVDLPRPVETAEQLWHELILLHPELVSVKSQVRIAQNGEFAQATARFSASDEVALIPPVSGG